MAPPPGCPARSAIRPWNFNQDGERVALNDNWEEAPNKEEIIASTVAPTHPLESAFLSSLSAGSYTAVIRGVNEGVGIGLVEVYDLDRSVDSQLANISTRGFVQRGDDVMIGGLIVVGEGSRRLIVRALGPSLAVEGNLADPTLQLFNGNGDPIAFNDNWATEQEAEIIATTIPPPHPLESAIVRTLPPDAYTAIVRGVNDQIGIALVEVYALP